MLFQTASCHDSRHTLWGYKTEPIRVDAMEPFLPFGLGLCYDTA